tara:strand:- start:84 stop:953 length:870 start_codon:yes stop_codon:yes gene_type:complete
VIGVDNFFRGKKEYLPTHKNFIFKEIDLLDYNSFKAILSEFQPSMILHYAAINGTEYFYEKPWEVLDNNIFSTVNILKVFDELEYKPKKILYASSSEVYGEFPQAIPTNEKEIIRLDISAVRDSYASSKAIDEFLVKNYCQQRGIEYLILRIFNTYGPRMDTSKYGQVVPEFIAKAISDEPFTIIGNGEHTRSFCFVSDHSRIAVQLIQNHSDLILNVGNDVEIRIIDLARNICKLVNRSFEPVYLEPRPNDPLRRCPDISNLRDIVDEPKFTLEEGLKKTIDWYMNKL